MPTIRVLLACSLLVVAGCAGLIPKGESKSRKEEYKVLVESSDKAKAMPDGEDCDGFTKKWKAWAYVERNSSNFATSDECKAHSGRDTCKGAQKLATVATGARAKMLKEGLASESAELDGRCLRWALLEAYGEPDLAEGLEVTEEIESLAKRQVSYWKDEIKQAKTFRDWVKRESEGICYTSTAPTTEKAPNAASFALVFPPQVGDESDIHIRCILPQSLASYPRDEADTIQLTYWKGDSYTGFVHTIPVEGQPSKDTYEVAIHPAVLAKAYAKLRKKNNADNNANSTYEHPLYFVRIDYVIGRKNGKREIADGDRVRVEDIWERDAKASGTFFLRAGD